MSHRKFWHQFWENRCVTLVDTEPEEDTAAATTEPPVGAVQMTEEDYNEYSAMLDSVTEAALRDGRERKQRLRQRLWLVQERIRRHTDRDRRSTTRDKRTLTRDRRTVSRDRGTSTRDVDRVSSGSVESDHIHVVYFKDEEATPSIAHRFLHYVHYNDKEEDED